MKTFICDSCKASFPNPIEEEKYRDEHGNWHTIDLCAPCKNNLKDLRKGNDKKFFDKVLKDKQ